MGRSYPSLLRRFGHWNVYVLLAIVCLIVTAGAQAAEDGPAKRVLMVHSFGSTAPPFTTHSNAFETTLTQEMGQRVDLDQVSLDMARYAQPDMEEPFVEFLLKRLAKWDPDLVVPVGSPAGRFVAKYRNRLFPHTPVIYTGMDLRTLPPGAFRTPPSSAKASTSLAWSRTFSSWRLIRPTLRSCWALHRLSGIGQSSFAVPSSLSQTA